MKGFMSMINKLLIPIFFFISNYIYTLDLNAQSLPPEITIDIPGLPEDSIPLQFVLIKAGTFIMGCTDYGMDLECLMGEVPQHKVTLTKDFYLSKYETTQSQWETFIDNNPSLYGDGPNHPADSVTWDNIDYFLDQLNTLGEGKFRLPTEAEWEYACRAGTITRNYWGNELTHEIVDQYEWYEGNSSGTTHEVGLKAPNPWGLYDMIGNISELCADWYFAYSKEHVIDPFNSEKNSWGHIIRGKKFNGELRDIRCTVRALTLTPAEPDLFSYFPGFRLVLEADSITTVSDWKEYRE